MINSGSFIRFIVILETLYGVTTKIYPFIITAFYISNNFNCQEFRHFIVTFLWSSVAILLIQGGIDAENRNFRNMHDKIKMDLSNLRLAPKNISRARLNLFLRNIQFTISYKIFGFEYIFDIIMYSYLTSYLWSHLWDHQISHDIFFGLLIIALLLSVILFLSKVFIIRNISSYSHGAHSIVLTGRQYFFQNKHAFVHEDSTVILQHQQIETVTHCCCGLMTFREPYYFGANKSLIEDLDFAEQNPGSTLL